MNNIEFTPFPKMARLSRDIVISEKIDGTNAQIVIEPGYKDDPRVIHSWRDETDTDMVMLAGSRTKWIVPSDDNFAFALWVKQNAEELQGLGHGRHFGEWWGRGIQRNYGLEDRRFSLFNAHRWGEVRPACCDVVPVLYTGPFQMAEVNRVISDLALHGSEAAPGFMDPEGIVVFHTAANFGFKKTIRGDESPKSLQQSA